MSYRPKDKNKNDIVISINLRQASMRREQMKSIFNKSTVEEMTAWRDSLQNITVCWLLLWMCSANVYILWLDMSTELMSVFFFLQGVWKWLKTQVIMVPVSNSLLYERLMPQAFLESLLFYTELLEQPNNNMFHFAIGDWGCICGVCLSTTINSLSEQRLGTMLV